MRAIEAGVAVYVYTGAKPNPLNYMCDVIARVANHHICDIAQLLSHRWTSKA